MTLEEIIKILGKLDDKMYVLRRDLKEASPVVKVYMDYIIELWNVDVKDTESNKCILSVHEVGQWTDKNRDELVNKVETQFMEQLLININNRNYERRYI